MHRRIVVTGLGVVTAIGIGKDEFWKAALAGKNGISPITSFDTKDFPTHNGGEIRNFRPEMFISRKKAEFMGRASQLAVAASRLAVEDAHLDLSGLPKEKCGICFGTTMGEVQVLQQLDDAWIKSGIDALDVAGILQTPCSVVVVNLARELNFKGPGFVIANACAAGNFSIGRAYDIIRLGRADVVLAVGADAFSRIAFTGFNRMLAIAPDKCQPFDKNRKGMMVSEGAGALILEPLDNALARNARIYAEILGYGISCDAHHMTAPLSEGISRAIKNALKESNIRAEEVNYINAHGTGTPANDKEECLAIKSVFLGSARNIAVSSTKSMLGHTMGAASAIEAAVCCLAVQNGLIPPTINYETPDPECGIDCVPNVFRKAKVDIALNNSSAFGGNNACLVLKKFSNN